MIQNPFKLQNWKIKKFLMVILFFQLSLLGLFALNKLGMDTPIIRPLIGFIYLSFIPGYLLLRILKLHNLCSIESFLYALGLSLFMDMFVGFLMNMLYPILGITDKPISEIPIVLTMAGVVFLLCIIAYLRDKNYNNPDFIDLKDILNPQVLFLSLIPFMAIFGTYLVNYYHNNILLMIMIVVIALVALIIGFTNWIDKKYYPYAIWIITIALVWHIMLITPYALNYDGEMYGAETTIENGFWNYNNFGNYNSVLSSKIFTPLICFICGLNLIWIYKVIFPLWISTFPVAIYIFVKIYLADKIAFLSSLIINSMGYIMIFAITTKQFMAEFFIILFIITIYNNMNKFKKKILTILIGFSIVWSHYGTSSIFMAGLLFTALFLKIPGLYNKNNNNLKEVFSLVGIYVTLYLSWYVYISDSSLFCTIISIGNNVLNSIWTEFLSPDTSRGAYMMTKQVSGLLLIRKYMNFGVAFFIILGMIKCLLNLFNKKSKFKFGLIYIGISLYFLAILVAAIVLPFFAVMGPDRLFTLSLVATSPFFSIGGIFFIKLILKGFKRDITTTNILKIMHIYIIILMLLNVGFIQEITKNHPRSIALSQKSIDNFGNLEDKSAFYRLLTDVYDVHAAKWASAYGKKNISRNNELPSSVGATFDNYGDRSLKIIGLNPHIKNIESNTYIWLKYANIKNIGFDINRYTMIWYYFNFSDVKPLLRGKNKIYDNKGSQIFLSN